MVGQRYQFPPDALKKAEKRINTGSRGGGMIVYLNSPARRLSSAALPGRATKACPSRDMRESILPMPPPMTVPCGWVSRRKVSSEVSQTNLVRSVGGF